MGGWENIQSNGENCQIQDEAFLLHVLALVTANIYRVVALPLCHIPYPQFLSHTRGN